MALRRIAFEMVNGAGLGRSEGDPIVRDSLEQTEEILAAIQRLFVKFVPIYLS
jgi:hypothetical protein